MSGHLFQPFIGFNSSVHVTNPTTWDATSKAANDSVSGNVFTGGTSGSVGFIKAVFSTSTGKYYWEYTMTSGISSVEVGACTTATVNSGNFNAGNFAGGYDYFNSTGNKINNAVSTAYGTAFTNGDIIGIALDLTGGKIYYSKNGVWQNSSDPVAGTNPAFTGLSGTFTAEVGHTGFNAVVITANFGATAFSGTVPFGYIGGLGT